MNSINGMHESRRTRPLAWKIKLGDSVIPIVIPLTQNITHRSIWVDVEMADLTNPNVIWLKGLLFIALGLLASAILVFRNPDIATCF